MKSELLLGAGALAAPDANSGAHRNSIPPTVSTYGSLLVAFRALDEELFGGVLNDPLFVLARRRGTLGHFAPDRFVCDSGEHAHEIALSPAYFKELGTVETLSTLAHELAHHWRHDFGPPNRKGSKGARGYHDRVWHQQMMQIGLPPVYARSPAGKVNRHSVSNTILPGGPFDRVAGKLIGSGFSIDWYDTARGRPTGEGIPEDDTPIKQGKRWRYDCPICDAKCWGKSGLRVVCGNCHAPMAVYLPKPVEGRAL